MDVTVVVGTFGGQPWQRLAEARAIPSAEALGVTVLHCHGMDLADARNHGALSALSEWLCFLDADDELEAGYFEAMAAVDADLRAPLVRYVKSGRAGPARVPAGTDNMADGNRLVIGTLVRRTMFLEVGGFRDWAFYEDWDLWQRCWLAGASIEFTEAVYRAHVRTDSRNRSHSREEKEAMHHAIRRRNLPHLYEAAG